MTREVCPVSEKIDVDTGKVDAGVACISKARLKGLPPILANWYNCIIQQRHIRNYLDVVFLQRAHASGASTTASRRAV